jgi:hypothetical protein
MSHSRSRKFTTLTQFTRFSRNLIINSTEGKEEITGASRGIKDFFVSRITELYV